MDAIAIALLTNATWAARVRRRNEAYQNSRLGMISDEKLTKVRMAAPIHELLEVIPTVEATGGPLIEELIPVMPKRLATTGRIHEDTIRPWVPKRIGDAWNAKYISSVRDQEVAKALWRISSTGGSVKENPNRELELADGTKLGPEDQTMCAIKVDEGSGKETPVSTWLSVRKGWAKTDEIHHARILTVDWTENGKRKSSEVLLTLPVADVYKQQDPLAIDVDSKMVGVRGNPKLARIYALDPNASVTPRVSLTQGDLLEFDDSLWVTTTFGIETQQIFTRPALSAGSNARNEVKTFVASAFCKGIVSVPAVVTGQ